jgi:hypothetical protein
MPTKTDAYKGIKDTQGFPSHLIPNSEKGEVWIRSYAKAAYKQAGVSCTNIFFFNSVKYFLLQDYAMGNQPIDPYKPQMGVTEDSAGAPIPINFKPLAVLTLLRQNALNKLNKVGYNINVRPLDPIAEAEKSAWYATQKSRLELKAALEKQSPQLAQLPALKSKTGDAEDNEELEIMNTYTYRSIRASKMKKVLRYVNQINDMERTRQEWKKDWFDFGVAVAKDDIDSNGAVRFRRVNPIQFICSPCQKRDFTDAYYMGEIMSYTIGDLKQMAGSQFSEAEFKDISRHTASENLAMGGVMNSPITSVSYPYDNKRTQVMDFEFSTSWYLDETQQRESQSEEKLFADSTHQEEKTSSDASPYERPSIQVWMKCKWIVGTDYLFDYGLVDNIKRPKKSLSNARASYHAFAIDLYNMQASSRVDRATAVEDAICLAWYKLQNEMARTIPNGWAIDRSKLIFKILGGGAKGGDNAEEVIKDINEFVQSGIFQYDGIMANGQAMEGIPIQALKAGISPDVVVYYNIIQMHIKTLRAIMGVSDVDTGASKPDRTTNEGVHLMFEASDNNLNDIIQAEKYMIETLSEDLIIRVQDVLKVRKIEGYVNALGKTTSEFISADESLSYDLFGIEISDKPDDNKRLQFETMVNDAYGKQELDAADIPVLNSIEDLDEAQKLFAYRKRKYMATQKQLKEEEMQRSLQIMQQTETIKAQAKIAVQTATMKAETERNVAVENIRAQMQREKLQVEMQMLQMKLNVDFKKKGMDVQGKQTVQSMKHHHELNSQLLDIASQGGDGSEPQGQPAPEG